MICVCILNFRLMDVYVSMKDDGHVASRDILHLVLRGCACTDER